MYHYINKQNIFLLFFNILITSYSSNAQNYIISYYPLINKAENYVVQDSLKKALVKYREAFHEIKTPFAKDLYNAAICASTLKNNLLTKHYLLKLAEKKTDVNFLVKNKFFRHNFTKKFKKDYEKIYNSVKLNNFYIDTLRKMENIDQSIRNKNKFNGNLVLLETIDPDYNNAKSLYKLIEKYGFPSENEIGLTNFSVLPNESSFSLILIHQFGKNYFNFRHLLLEAIQNGLLLPNTGLELLTRIKGDDFNSDGFGGYYGIGYYSTVYYMKQDSTYKLSLKVYKEKEIKAINSERNKLGIDTVENFYKKAVFQEKNSDFIFGLKIIRFSNQ